MNFLKNIFNKIKNISRIKKIILIIAIIVIAVLVYKGLTSSKQAAQYQTSQVTRGTLVVSLTEAGQVSVANKVSMK